MKKIEIKKMTLNDFSQIENNLLSDFDDFWHPNLLKSEFMQKNKIYIVAKKNENIVGFAGCMINFAEMEIMNLVTKKSERGNGIGNLLLEKLIEIAKNNEIEEIFLEVNQTNEIARKLYEKAEFLESGRRKNYYGQNQDAIIMVKKIKNL